MPKTAIITGMLLTLLGLIVYVLAIPLGAERASVTALIPTFLGVPLMLLGYFSVVKPNLRMHLMHVAVLLGLLGFLASAGRLISTLLKPAAHTATTLPADAPKATPLVAPVSMLLMALICAVFVILCIRSFITARRTRLATPS